MTARLRAWLRPAYLYVATDRRGIIWSIGDREAAAIAYYTDNA